MIIFRIITGRSFMKFPVRNVIPTNDAPLTTDRWVHNTDETSFHQSSFDNREIGRGIETDIEEETQEREKFEYQ
jgi:hypothetical protein